MTRFPTIGDLQARELRKALYEHTGESAQVGNEAELLTRIDTIKQTLGALMQQLASIRSRFVGNVTPQGKAALEVMGKDVAKSIAVLEEAHMEAQRRLNGIRRNKSQTLSKNGFNDAYDNYTMLKGMTDDINRSGIRVDERVRRDLRLQLIAAEIRLQESA